MLSFVEAASCFLIIFLLLLARALSRLLNLLLSTLHLPLFLSMKNIHIYCWLGSDRHQTTQASVRQTRDSTMWMRSTEQHYVRRRARSLSQMVLLSWRAAMQHEQLSVLAHDIFQLRADLEEAEMQITEIHDPARTQVNRDPHIQCKCGTLRHSATHCNTLQHTAKRHHAFLCARWRCDCGACVFMCVCVCECVRVYVCMCVHVCVCLCVCVVSYRWIFSCVCVCICVCLCIYVSMCLCVCDFRCRRTFALSFTGYR